MAHQFTPGPWVVRTIDESLGTIETLDGEIQIAQTFQIRANDRLTLHKERKANTVLIASAPNLLFALEQIIDDLPRQRDWLDPNIELFAKDLIQINNVPTE